LEKINPTLKSLIVNISELKPDPKNARKHNEKNIDSIIKSLENFGQQKPIVVSSDGTVIAGNGTLEAMQKMGWQKVAVVRFDSNEKHKATAYAIADNRTAELAEWDVPTLSFNLEEIKTNFDIKDLGFNKNALDTLAIKANAVQVEQDEVSDQLSGFKVKKGDLFELGNHRLFCGDSCDFLSFKSILGNEKIVLTVTDPPYGVDYVGASGNVGNKIKKLRKKISSDELKNLNLEGFLKTHFSNVFNFSSDSASVYCFYAANETLSFIKALDSSGFFYYTICIWNKNRMSYNGSRIKNSYEPFLYYENKSKPKWNGGNVTLDVFDYERAMVNDLHPTMKPLPLICKLIELSSDEMDLVFDGFGGSGTTLIACEKLSRFCRMIELDETYCSKIVRRWEDFTGKKAKLIGNYS
jgi:DNA modification methylase